MIKRHENNVTVVEFGDKNIRIDLLQATESKTVGLRFFEDEKEGAENVVLYFKSLESIETIENCLGVVKDKFKELNNLKINTNYDIEQLKQSNKVMHERLSSLIYILDNNVSHEQKQSTIKRAKEAIELYR